ncbi:hypothetical protein [Marinilactibacillus psychrotolerans]
MAKFNLSLKLIIVNEYLNGLSGYNYLAIKYVIKSESETMY